MINRRNQFFLNNLLVFCLVILMAGTGYRSLTCTLLDAFADGSNVQV